MKNNIKSLRYERVPKITQKELAYEIGISESMISQYEKQTKCPSLKTLKEIANAFTKLLQRKIKPSDIMDDDF